MMVFLELFNRGYYKKPCCGRRPKAISNPFQPDVAKAHSARAPTIAPLARLLYLHSSIASCIPLLKPRGSRRAFRSRSPVARSEDTDDACKSKRDPIRAPVRRAIHRREAFEETRVPSKAGNASWICRSAQPRTPEDDRERQRQPLRFQWTRTLVIGRQTPALVFHAQSRSSMDRWPPARQEATYLQSSL